MFLVWLLLGAAGGYVFGWKKKTAMGPLGDAMLGVGGGVAGGVLVTGIGLGWPPLTALGAAAGGAAMVAMVGKLKE
ncbi:MAG: hypothetical protein EA355_07110 [Rhodobacteraceae bacterium]|nr:MAG: hypothetical protein EA355_07110 [Paracoccaceae bacterium]